SAGEFTARNVTLRHDFLAEIPFRRGEFFRRTIVAFADDEDTDRRSLAHRLDDIRRVHHMTERCLRARHNNAFGNGQARRTENLLRTLLVHGECGCEHTGMGVGNAEHLEQALNAPVLTPAAMQRIESDIRLQREKLIGNIAPDINLRHAVAARFQRLGTSPARDEADFAFRAPAALQDGDMLAAHTLPSPRFKPMRRISHSSVTPLVAFTRARTSSPSSSRSLAVASPVLMRKLQ